MDSDDSKEVKTFEDTHADSEKGKEPLTLKPRNAKNDRNVPAETAPKRA